MHDFIIVTPTSAVRRAAPMRLRIGGAEITVRSTLIVTPLADQYCDVPADQGAIAPFYLRAPACSCAVGIVIVLYRNPQAGSRALCVVFVAVWSCDVTKYERA